MSFLLRINVIAGFLFLTSMHAQNAWMFEDSDPNYSNPNAHDSLMLMTPNYLSYTHLTGFNTCQTVGGTRTINAHTPDGSCWVSEVSYGGLQRIRQNGTFAFQNNLCVFSLSEEANGCMFALRNQTTITGDSVFEIDPNGVIINRAAYGGIDCVYDSVHRNLWMVGVHLTRLKQDLSHCFTVAPFSWTAVSVDFTSSGNVWVASRYPNEIIEFDTLGNILQAENLPDCPYCVRVDRMRDLVWVNGFFGLMRYDVQSSSLTAIDTSRGWTLDIQTDSGIVWAADYSYLKRFDHNGNQISSHHEVWAQRYISLTYKAPYSPAGIPNPGINAAVLQVYPSPCADEVQVCLNGMTDGPFIAEIFDERGNLIRSITGLYSNRSILRIDVSALEDGLYIMRVSSSADIASGRFVVSH